MKKKESVLLWGLAIALYFLIMPLRGYYSLYSAAIKYGEYIFTPISIIATVGDKTVVESRTYYDAKAKKMISTVKNYDSVKKGDD